MGCEPPKSDSDPLSNSGDENGKLEIMNSLKENKNTIINRVWIVKKSINLKNIIVNLNPFVQINFPSLENKPKLLKPIKNVFNIRRKYGLIFSHWAIILELSNDSYVNIQFGRSGFSLEEFNKTEVEGENVLNSIVCTWGQDGDPFSFCYLGNANYKYDDLKEILKTKKEKETKLLKEKGKIYYNACFRNCQNFICDVEKILFGNNKIWHSFDYYLDEFYKHFFPEIDLNKLKTKYENELKMKNEKLFSLNFEEIKKIYLNVNMENEKSKEKFEKLKKNIFKLYYKYLS